MMRLTNLRLATTGPILLAVVALAAAGAAVAFGQAPPSATPTPEVTATPSPTLVVEDVPPEPTRPPKEEPEAPPKIPALAPAGPVAGDPVVVHTGDGDCLNVRNAPSTQFAESILFCAIEGHALWLTSERVEADGEVWRRAIGLGWVAERYTKPATPLALPVGLGGIAVSLPDYSRNTLEFARLDASGDTVSSATFEGGQQGIGWNVERISPDGEYIAIGAPRTDGWQDVIIGDATGAEVARIAQAAALGWGDSGRLLLHTTVDCGSGSGCLNQLAVFEAASGATIPLGERTALWPTAQWHPSGESVIAVIGGLQLVELALDGTAREIVTLPPDSPGIGEFAISPDGTRLLSASFIGAAQVFDLRTGAVDNLPRAAQRTDIGGRCGGGGTGLVSWLDDGRVVYHENAAERGQNGITVIDLATRTRTVIPFSTVQDIQPLGDSLIAFTTIESDAAGGSWPVTWVMDVDSRQSWPVTTGQAAVFLE